jgi:hypothetical protein
LFGGLQFANPQGATLQHANVGLQIAHPRGAAL